MAKKQRLDKVLSHMGYGSRKECRSLIKQKVVNVNGVVMTDSGYQLDPYVDDIRVHGEKLVYRQFIYVMLNKPQGVISATEDAMDRTVIDLLSEELVHFSPFPVGRLDKNTEGLLLLTNDGQLAHELLSPKKNIEKTYYVEVDGPLDEQDQLRMSEGLVLDDGYETLPAQLHIKESGVTSKAEITIVEGKFHQVKRMFRALGRQVTYLQRIKMGPLHLDPELELGTYRELTEEELQQLRIATGQMAAPAVSPSKKGR